MSIGYALKSTSFSEQASHAFHGPRLASGKRFLSSAFKACLCLSHSFSFSGGMPGAPEFRLGKTSEHALGGIGAENRLLKPVALLDLSI